MRSLASLDMGVLDQTCRRYVLNVTAALAEALGPELVGAYLLGSAILGDFVSGRSDIDLVAICERDLSEHEARHVLTVVAQAAQPCPTKGLDFYLVTRQTALAPPRPPSYQVHILSWIGRESIVGAGDTSKPRLAIIFVHCRTFGRAVVGPDPRRVFAPIPRSWFLNELADEMVESWTVSPYHYRVLNACRAWQYLVEGETTSKIVGAEWARQRVSDPSLIDAAVSSQLTGQPTEADPGQVDAFVGRVIHMLRAAS
jgi:hypothetical protein